MSFSRQRVPGGWLLSSTIEPAELEYFDDAISKAVDGYGGGAYSFQNDLVFGGAPGVDFTIQMETAFDDDVTCRNDTFLEGPIYHYGSSGFYAPAYFENEVGLDDIVTLNGSGSFFCYGGVSFYGIASFEPGSIPIFDAPATFNAAVDINSNVDVSGGLAVAGPLVATGVVSLGSASAITIVQGRCNIRDVIAPQSNGRLLEPGLVLPNANATIDIRSTRNFFIPSFGSTTRNYTVDPTGLEDGDWFMVHNASGGLQSFSGAVAIDVLPDHGFKAVRVLGSWQLHQWKYTT